MPTSVIFFLLTAFFHTWAQSAKKEAQSAKKPIDIGHIKTQETTQTLKLIFAGDVMGHEPQIRAAEIKIGQEYDYSGCFTHVAPLISQADLGFANLEVTLPGKPPYRGYPLFRSPDALAKALRQTGFKVLLTANNHTNDGGKFGVNNTILTLYNTGLYQTGSFQNPAEREAFYPLIIYRKGFKLAILNYTYSTNGIATRPPSIVNIIDPPQIKKDFTTAKALTPDFIIAVMHWGAEYQQQPSKKQIVLAKQMIEWGADLIVGAHPHVVQPIKFYRNAQKEVVPVAYSLGNFISNQRRSQTDGGLLLEVDIAKKSGANRAYLDDLNYHIVWRYIQKTASKTNYLVLPVHQYLENTQQSIAPTLPKRDSLKMLQYHKSTTKLLEPEFQIRKATIRRPNL